MAIWVAEPQEPFPQLVQYAQLTPVEQVPHVDGHGVAVTVHCAAAARGKAISAKMAKTTESPRRVQTWLRFLIHPE